MGYSKKVITGFSWDSLLKLAVYALTVLKIYFLARILDPADFGLFSLVVIAIGIGEAVTQTGVNLTIIQSKHSVEYFLNTAWVIAIGRGFLIGVLMMLIGFGMNFVFDQDQLLILVAIAAIVPVIKGFINPYVVALHKKMLYSHDVMYKFLIQSSLILVTLLLGFWLRNVYALVLGMVLAAVIETFLSHLLFKVRPKFEYIPSRAKIIFDNAKWLSVGSLLNYLVEHIDDFLIGTITNTHALGLYHNAYSLTHKASYDVSKSVHYGTIPVYTKLNNDSKRLKRAFGKTVLSTLLIILLFALPIYLFNEQLITFLLGEKWIDAIPLVRPLIIAGVIQSIFMVCYTLMLAQKNYKIMNLHLFATLLLMSALIYLGGTRSGLMGAVKGIAISRAVTLSPLLWFLYQFISKRKLKKAAKRWKAD